MTDSKQVEVEQATEAAAAPQGGAVEVEAAPAPAAGSGPVAAETPADAEANGAATDGKAAGKATLGEAAAAAQPPAEQPRAPAAAAAPATATQRNLAALHKEMLAFAEEVGARLGWGWGWGWGPPRGETSRARRARCVRPPTPRSCFTRPSACPHRRP